jgi:hypothetical protein
MATNIVVGKKLPIATILNFAAKLFATELIATTSNDFFVVAVKHFCSNFKHRTTTFVAAKNVFSCKGNLPFPI